MKHHFILADCNNFYASCEGIFNPKLEGQPIVVLSNNDGCIISRSQEAKLFGIKMGEPYFKVKDLCRKKNVTVFSSNYTLYGNISERVMTILSDAAPGMECYSTDEAFLNYDGNMPEDKLLAKCFQLKSQLKKWVGIPISLGIGPTKTLAKVANSLAKKNPTGIISLNEANIRKKILQEFPIEDVWGIGSNLKEQLHCMGIFTAWEFCQADASFIRRKTSVVVERLILELRGISCLALELPAPKKSMTCSRSFGKALSEISDLEKALSSFVNTACIKLRKQKYCATALHVFLEGFIDKKTGTRSYYSKSFQCLNPTSYTPLLITMAKKGLEDIFVKDQRYKKGGIMLLDLIPENEVVQDLFNETSVKENHLMNTITAINKRHGKDKLFFGAMGTSQDWKGRCNQRSNHFTSDWSNLAIAKA